MKIRTDDDNITISFFPQNPLREQHEIVLEASFIGGKFHAEVCASTPGKLDIKPTAYMDLNHLALAVVVLQRYEAEIIQAVTDRDYPGSMQIPHELHPSIRGMTDGTAGRIYQHFIDTMGERYAKSRVAFDQFVREQYEEKPSGMVFPLLVARTPADVMVHREDSQKGNDRIIPLTRKGKDWLKASGLNGEDDTYSVADAEFHITTERTNRLLLSMKQDGIVYAETGE